MRINHNRFKLFLDGDTKKNAGPANVNKELIKNSNIIYTKNKNKIIRIIETIYKIIFANAVVFSGIPRKSHIFIAKIFKKKIIYLMHGYLKYDNEVNLLKLSKREITDEEYLFKKSDLVLCVSEKFAEWFKVQRMDLKNKIYFLNGGINKKEYFDKCNKDPNTLAVAGGNRNIKNNKIVSEAVNKLNNDGFKCKLNLYGEIVENNERIIGNDNVTIVGQLKQNEFFNELNKTKLFVLNTTIESFGLSVIDALLCGCNILIPYNSGVTSIIEYTENDVIYNCNDINEIEKKIKYNLENDNNKRIVESINFNKYTWDKVSERLIEIGKLLTQNKDYHDVK